LTRQYFSISSDCYWTAAWNNYIGTPSNEMFANIVAKRLQPMYQTITNMAEFYLG
jgi:hypothetical protein